MSYYAVWMDSRECKVFEFTPGKVKEQHIKMSGHETMGHKQTDKHTVPHEFYNQIVEKVKNAHELLLLGPGQAKTQFSSFLETHHQKDLKKKIVGIENMDHPTQPQIVAHARKFFKAHNLFESI